MARARTVHEVMSAPAVVITPDNSIASASRLMAAKGIGAVIVLDGEDVVGILSERDVLQATAAAGADTAVRQWMTAEPQAVAPTASPSQALDTMVGGGFRHVPVVEAGTAVGMLSVRDLMPLARLERVAPPGQLEAPKGLEGLVVADTAVGDVRGDEGFFHYRQYDATELARRCALEEVWYLHVHGELPTREKLREFAGTTARLRALPARTASLLPAVASATSAPVDALRTGLSLAGAELALQPVLDTPPEELAHQALLLTAVVPTLAAAAYRIRDGHEPVPPDPDLPHAANYLWMMTGRTPDAAHVRGLEQYLIATIDHGLNASTFTARVITSTGADVAAALVGAIGALSGPLHGGAPSRALGLLDEIGEPGSAGDVIRRKVERGERIMGFGHRVYKTRDPRSELLREAVLAIGGDRAELAVEIEDTVVRTLAELKPGRQLYANVEYYAGVLFEQIGLPPELFTPTFVCSRTIGWTAHVLEQAADNRLIRPTARYSGPPAPQPIPAPQARADAGSTR